MLFIVTELFQVYLTLLKIQRSFKIYSQLFLDPTFRVTEYLILKRLKKNFPLSTEKI